MQIHILARAMFYRPDFMREMVLKGRHTELQKCDTTEQLDMPAHTQLIITLKKEAGGFKALLTINAAVYD